MCGFVVSEDRERMMGYGSCDAVADVLDGLLSRCEYVAGNRFTAADVYLGSEVGMMVKYGLLEKRPAFERYWDRISTRPAAVRARQIDDLLAADKPQGAAG